jgi:hypothetical protein
MYPLWMTALILLIVLGFSFVTILATNRIVTRRLGEFAKHNSTEHNELAERIRGLERAIKSLTEEEHPVDTDG